MQQEGLFLLSKKEKKWSVSTASRQFLVDVFVFGSQPNETAHANVFVSLICLVSQS